MKEDCGCSDKKDPNQPCTCWKKWLWIGLGLAVVAGVGYYAWKKYRAA